MANEEDKPGEGQPGEGQLPKKEGEGGKESEGGWQVPKAGATDSKKWETKKKELWAVGDDKPKPGEPEKKPGFAKKASVGPFYEKKAEGAVSRKFGDDKTFIQFVRGEVKVEALKASYDLDKKSAELTVVDAEAEGSLVHGQVDFIDKIKHLIFGPPPPAPPPAPTAPMAARISDLTMHLGPLAPGPGSSNVFIGGVPAWRAGLDMHLCPAPGATPHGGGPTLPGEPTVLINGSPAARATDYVVEPAGGPDVIAIGCPTVMIGKATPPPPGAKTEGDKSDPWVIFESVGSADVGKGKAGAELGVEADLSKMKGKAQAKGEIEVAVLKGELPLKVRIRIPFTSYYVGLGVKGEGALLTLGAEAHAGVKINDGKTLFEATAGAKVDAGLAGLGLGFGVDISKK